MTLERWASQPDSVTGPIALAKAYVEYAWRARGSGYAHTVTGDGWRVFGERINQAEVILNRASALKHKCPAWYHTMMLVARANGWDAAKAAALFRNAVAFAPEYYYYYQERAYSLLPKWNGEEGDSAKFAQESADRVGGKKGDLLYWQIAANLVCNCGNQDAQNNFSWLRVRRGYDVLVELYGTSPLRQNQMGYMAVKFGDVVAADELFTVIGDNWDEGTWKTKQAFQTAKTWAATSAAYIRSHR